MISAENLSKSFGKQILFEGVSFKVNARERIGLVGRNGHGKTTLFRMITGEVSPDEGVISIPKNYRIGHIKQHLDFTEETILKECMKGLRQAEKDHSWKVEKILAGLGFSTSDMQRHPSEFSGGYQVRLNLIKVLVSEPDMLLLDEPTNYLDITSIRWIERFLISWPRELMLITHDRSFMDKIVTHTLGIHRRKIRKIQGNTEKFYTQIAQEEEIYEKTRINDERKRKEVELFISRFRAKARLANMVQSRIKTLEKREKKDKISAIKTLDFSFRSKPFHGKYTLTAHDISFSYTPENDLIKDFSITIGAKDRICVIGKNGKGKTTLLRLLAGSLVPNQGEIVQNPNMTQGVFVQTNVTSLVDERTIEEEILFTHPDVDRQYSRNICGAMMFEGDEALKKIKVISGGEKSRVMLGKLLVKPVNLLLLDEPTNHLDMESCDALLEAIDDFNGAAVIVTHNEMFLHALAERLIVFDNNQITVFEGDYQSFLERIGWSEEKESSLKAEPQREKEDKLTKKDLRKKRSEIITERSRTLRPLETKIEQVEKSIMEEETNLSKLHQDLLHASQNGEGSKIGELSKAILITEQKINCLFDELQELTTSLEEKTQLFEEKFQQLEQDLI